MQPTLLNALMDDSTSVFFFSADPEENGSQSVSHFLKVVQRNKFRLFSTALSFCQRSAKAKQKRGGGGEGDISVQDLLWL